MSAMTSDPQPPAGPDDVPARPVGGAPRRRRRRLARAGAAAAVVLAAAAAVPFVFTTAIVRRYVAGSAYPDLRFRSATLTPLGTLTLRGVELPDRAAPGGRPVLAAAAVRLRFRWSGLAAGRFKSIAVDGLEVAVRPGADRPVSLLALLSPPPAAGGGAAGAASAPAGRAAGTLPAAGGAAGTGVWVDELVAEGALRFEGFDGWRQAMQLPARMPLHVVAHMTGDAAAPAHEISAVVGDPDAPPAAAAPLLAGRARVASGRETVVTVDTLTVSNLTPVLSRAVVGAWGGRLPAGAVRDYTGRIDRVQVTGAAVVGADVALNLDAEVRDVSVRGEGGAAVAVERAGLSGHVAARWPAARGPGLRDFVVSDGRLTWDAVQAGEWRLTRAVADLRAEGAEVTLTDLQAALGEAEVSATGAFDLSSRLLTRARVWVKEVDAARLAGRLPGEVRRALPGSLDGTLSARLFLTESDADHLAARVEVACPEQLTVTSAGAAVPLGPPGAGADLRPLAAVTNLLVAGAVSWNYRADTPPTLSRGRLTADQLDLYPPRNPAVLPLPVTKIVADFAAARGVVKLEDLYANLPNSARLSAEGTYDAAAGTLDRTSFRLDNVDAAVINPWLPPGVSLAGQFALDLHLDWSAGRAGLSGSLAASPEAGAKWHGGAAVLTGGPSVTFGGAVDRATGRVTADKVAVRNITSLELDGPFVEQVRAAVRPAAGSAADALLGRLGKGAAAALDEVVAGGTYDPGAGFVRGAVTVNNLSVASAAGVGNPIGVEGLSVSAEVAAPLAADRWAAGLEVKAGEVQARKVTVDRQSLTEVRAKATAAGGRARVSDLAFVFDDGKFSGEAAVSLPAGLDRLRLDFTGLSQLPITQQLYPDTFTAEGPVSGTLTLGRGRDEAGVERLLGEVDVRGDGAGRLKISREVSAATFAHAAKAAAGAGGAGSIIPADFDQIVINQLADYRYARGEARIRDGARGLELELHYTRVPLTPGEAGYGVPVTIAGQTVKASFEFNLGGTVVVPKTIEGLVTDLFAPPRRAGAGRPAGEGPGPAR
jgi:hypothetical protein